MKKNAHISIKVPGSTSNLGPGFDSIGLAINRYLYLEAHPSDKWEFGTDSDHLKELPQGEENMIYQAAYTAAQYGGEQLKPCSVHVKSDLPIARGLGSSAAAVVAGVELANILLNLNLTDREKLEIALKCEGHLDNVAASIYGGLIVGSKRLHELDVISGIYPHIDLVALIPAYYVKTVDARGILPETLSFTDAVMASGISNVLTAAIMRDDWKLAGRMMQKDIFHHPYRKHLIKEYNTFHQIVQDEDVYGTAISGAGPTLLCFTAKDTGEKIVKKLKANMPKENVWLLGVSATGVESYSGSLFTKL